MERAACRKLRPIEISSQFASTTSRFSRPFRAMGDNQDIFECETIPPQERIRRSHLKKMNPSETATRIFASSKLDTFPHFFCSPNAPRRIAADHRSRPSRRTPIKLSIKNMTPRKFELPANLQFLISLGLFGDEDFDSPFAPSRELIRKRAVITTTNSRSLMHS